MLSEVSGGRLTHPELVESLNSVEVSPRGSNCQDLWIGPLGAATTNVDPRSAASGVGGQMRSLSESEAWRDSVGACANCCGEQQAALSSGQGFRFVRSASRPVVAMKSSRMSTTAAGDST